MLVCASDPPAIVPSTPDDGERVSEAPTKRSIKKGTIAWVIAVVLVGLLVVYSIGGAGAPSPLSTSQTTSTSYNTKASFVIAATAQQYPAGFNATSFGLLNPSYPGEQTGAYAILYQPLSSGNITVLVFNTAGSSHSYYISFTSNVQGLVGYTDISSVLSGYQQYGKCYAYGEDVENIAVANGVCQDGNTFLQVHLSSNESFDQAESDLSTVMGALYQNV